MSTITVATCSLNQWALDFDGNLARIEASIRAAAAAGATYRLGPELEVCGYGCEDHFLENDTVRHSWQSVARLLAGDLTVGIVCDVGLPLLHNGVRYNVRALLLNRRILLLRPKLFLADDGNYRESRWFTAWPYDGGAAPLPLEACALPECVVAATAGGQTHAPFGVAVLESLDGTLLASETCEELFTPASPHIGLGLDGVEVFANGSGSHHQLRKLHTRVDLMRGATTRGGGGAYLYANQFGCDGGRLYYDGCAIVLVNGECVGQGAQFGVADVEVITATIDLAAVRSARAATASRGCQAAAAARRRHPRVAVPLDMRVGVVATRSGGGGVASAAPTSSADVAVVAAASPPPPIGSMLLLHRPATPSSPRPVLYLTPSEEIALGPACWLWDFLRRSGASGFFLPLSGGADSAATCALVAIMCRLVFDAGVGGGDAGVLDDIRRVLRRGGDYTPASPRELCNAVLHTAYMATANSSGETRYRAAAVAADVGCYHLLGHIDAAVDAMIALFMAMFGGGGGGKPHQEQQGRGGGERAAGGRTHSTTISGAAAASAPEAAATGDPSSSTPLRPPRYAVAGGTRAEDLALQNLQARLRMVLSYLCAQLLPWMRGRSGFLLVLGSANVDEALRGYMTKYDCR